MARTREAVWEERYCAHEPSPFWQYALRVALEVETWPAWKRNSMGNLDALTRRVEAAKDWWL